MTTEHRRFFVIAVSVVLCAPVVRGALSGDVHLSSAAGRAGAALIFAWLGVRGLHRLLNGYRRQTIAATAPTDVDLPEERPPSGTAGDRRRRS